MLFRDFPAALLEQFGKTGTGLLQSDLQYPLVQAQGGGHPRQAAFAAGQDAADNVTHLVIQVIGVAPLQDLEIFLEVSLQGGFIVAGLAPKPTGGNPDPVVTRAE